MGGGGGGATAVPGRPWRRRPRGRPSAAWSWAFPSTPSPCCRRRRARRPTRAGTAGERRLRRRRPHQCGWWWVGGGGLHGRAWPTGWYVGLAGGLFLLVFQCAGDCGGGGGVGGGGGGRHRPPLHHWTGGSQPLTSVVVLFALVVDAHGCRPTHSCSCPTGTPPLRRCTSTPLLPSQVVGASAALPPRRPHLPTARGHPPFPSARRCRWPTHRWRWSRRPPPPPPPPLNRPRRRRGGRRCGYWRRWGRRSVS